MFNWTNNRLGFSISLLNRPLRSGLNESAEDARGLVLFTHGLAIGALKTISKKSRRSIACKLATLIWSSSRSFTRQEIRVRFVSLTHQSYMAYIRPSYCYTRQKFGASIGAGSFIVLISQSNAVGSRKKWTSVTFPTHSRHHVFYSWSQASFTSSQSSSTSFFCHANIRKSCRLFYVCVSVIFSNPK